MSFPRKESERVTGLHTAEIDVHYVSSATVQCVKTAVQYPLCVSKLALLSMHAKPLTIFQTIFKIFYRPHPKKGEKRTIYFFYRPFFFLLCPINLDPETLFTLIYQHVPSIIVSISCYISTPQLLIFNDHYDIILDCLIQWLHWMFSSFSLYKYEMYLYDKCIHLYAIFTHAIGQRDQTQVIFWGNELTSKFHEVTISI